jgi:hypothetical protein
MYCDLRFITPTESPRAILPRSERGHALDGGFTDFGDFFSREEGLMTARLLIQHAARCSVRQRVD